ncbi:hypothetical protein [Oceanimonas smirnovii]|uniref:hypothetical protein n=1 Tax=Oceanimonas smirnovii TaxID=264574 RepID=UPI003FD02F99
MSKVTTVMLQGVRYHWNGEDILVDDGVGLPWSLAGPALEQVELYNEDGDVSGEFSINFEQQSWWLQGDNMAGAVTLVDDSGAALAALLSDPEAPLPVSLDDILLGSELAGHLDGATIPDTGMPDAELLDDVINWLSVYSGYE